MCAIEHKGPGRTQSGVWLAELDTGAETRPDPSRDHENRTRPYRHRRAVHGAKAGGIGEQGLCGFVLKKDSPTCGMERVRVYNGKGVPTRDGFEVSS